MLKKARRFSIKKCIEGRERIHISTPQKDFLKCTIYKDDIWMDAGHSVSHCSSQYAQTLWQHWQAQSASHF